MFKHSGFAALVVKVNKDFVLRLLAKPTEAQMDPFVNTAEVKYAEEP